jgi:hypothetical protein
MRGYFFGISDGLATGACAETLVPAPLFHWVEDVRRCFGEGVDAMYREHQEAERLRTLMATRAGAFLLTLLIGCAGVDTEEQWVVELRLDPFAVALEDSDTAFVGNLLNERAIDVSPTGMIAVADRITARVLVYHPDGSLRAVTGRYGDGPGEFRAPARLTWVGNDELWVMDVLPRITVFDSNLRLTTIHNLEFGDFGTGVQFARDRVVVSMMIHPRIEADRIATLGMEGVRLHSFLDVDPRAWDVPFLGGLYVPYFRVVGDTVFAGSNLTYPIHIFNLEGDSLGTFGAPPPSFIEPRTPELGEFNRPPGRSAYEAWVRSFGTISSLWVVQDSLVVVEHRYLDPEDLPYYRMDVYERSTLRKIAEDVELPGMIATTHEDRLWLLTGQPPEPWTFSTFELQLRLNQRSDR